MRKFNKQGFQQIQIDLNLIKIFFKENFIIDTENILDGFFLEIMNNVSFNTKNPENFDEQVKAFFLLNKYINIKFIILFYFILFHLIIFYL
jgi:hypothetical protein